MILSVVCRTCKGKLKQREQRERKEEGERDRERGGEREREREKERRMRERKGNRDQERERNRKRERGVGETHTRVLGKDMFLLRIPTASQKTLSEQSSFSPSRSALDNLATYISTADRSGREVGQHLSGSGSGSHELVV